MADFYTYSLHAMKTRLVTDSTADLPAEICQRHQINVIPITLVIDGKSYLDGIDISRSEFYARMPNMQTPASTAAPSAGSFIACYERLFAEGAEEIISVHTAAALSGIYNAARLAAENFAGRVQVIDSQQLSLGVGFQIMALAEKLKDGEKLKNITKFLNIFRKKFTLIAILDTLEYLRRSGRVSWAKARLGSLLQLKPMIRLHEGEVENLGAVRTTRLANLRLLEMLQGLGELDQIAILHTNAEARARAFWHSYAPHQAEPPFLINVTPAIGAHLGPNGLGFAVISK